MSNCVACGGFSGRREICYQCAVHLWPKQLVNPGAKVRHAMLIPVPSRPVYEPVHELAGALPSK